MDQESRQITTDGLVLKRKKQGSCDAFNVSVESYYLHGFDLVNLSTCTARNKQT